MHTCKNIGYGVSIPSNEEIKLQTPEVIKQNGRYGIRLKAVIPSIHMIKVDVESIFEPIIGSEEQSKALIDSLKKEGNIWDANIFGRKLSDVVNDGVKQKLFNMSPTSQMKFKDTLQKVINCGNGGIIAIIL